MSIRCQAIFDDDVAGTTWNTRPRVRRRPRRRCTRNGNRLAGHLRLCAAHASLCRQGFVAESGDVDGIGTIRRWRRNIRRTPGPHHSWLTGANPQNR